MKRKQKSRTPQLDKFLSRIPFPGIGGGADLSEAAMKKMNDILDEQDEKFRTMTLDDNKK